MTTLIITQIKQKSQRNQKLHSPMNNLIIIIMS